jgi:hypothetical protein
MFSSLPSTGMELCFLTAPQMAFRRPPKLNYLRRANMREAAILCMYSIPRPTISTLLLSITREAQSRALPPLPTACRRRGGPFDEGACPRLGHSLNLVGRVPRKRSREFLAALMKLTAVKAVELVRRFVRSRAWVTPVSTAREGGEKWLRSWLHNRRT